MPRPRKCRNVCRMPDTVEFVPVHGNDRKNIVIMTVDEYETIRLIDGQGCSQEECGQYMHIARTTVQQIYSTARKKLAWALVEGRALKIEGGDYRLCDERGQLCGGRGCHKHNCGDLQEEKII